MEKYTLNDYISVLTSQDKIIFYSYQSNTYKYYENDDALLFLTRLLSKERTIEELVKKVQTKYIGVTEDDVEKALKSLMIDNIVSRGRHYLEFQMTGRWAKQRVFFNEYPGNDTLKNKRVAIIGLGGSGSWVAQSLVMADIGSLLLIDSDAVEASNLNRQPLYRESDIGKSKLFVAKNFLNTINPQTKIRCIDTFVRSYQDLTHVLDENLDLVISCADFPSTKQMGLWITRYCYPRHIDHIIGGGYNTHIGSIGMLVDPGHTCCFSCYIKTAENEILDIEKKMKRVIPARRKNNIGSLSAIAGSVGNFIALDAIKQLTGFAKPDCLGNFLDYDFDKNIWKHELVERNKACEICGRSITDGI